jgi:hypothetical protein
MPRLGFAMLSAAHVHLLEGDASRQTGHRELEILAATVDPRAGETRVPGG